MIGFIQEILPVLVLIANVGTVILFFALLFRNSCGKSFSMWVGKHSLLFSFLVVSLAVSGSLFYSNIVGFEPCLFCWWQRIAIYPLLVLFLVALHKKDRGVFKYSVPLSLLALLIAIYHSYVQWGGSPLIPCDATASCSMLYVYAFGYITIPSMTLSIAILLLLIAWASKVYDKR